MYFKTQLHDQVTIVSHYMMKKYHISFTFTPLCKHTNIILATNPFESFLASACIISVLHSDTSSSILTRFMLAVIGFYFTVFATVSIVTLTNVTLHSIYTLMPIARIAFTFIDTCKVNKPWTEEVNISHLYIISLTELYICIYLWDYFYLQKCLFSLLWFFEQLFAFSRKYRKLRKHIVAN